MAQDIQIKLDLINKSFKDGLKESTKQAEAFKENTTKQFGLVQASFGSLIGNLGALAFTKLASSIGASFDKAIKEASEAEQEVNNLTVALKQANIYSDKTAKSLQDFANTIEQTTIYTGGATLQIIALMASLTDLDENGLKAAAQASVDLAATLNIDLASASDMITKAINGNTTGFKKMGIEIKKGDTDAERLTNTLKALEKQTDAAANKTNTYAGATTQLDNAETQLYETLGKVITQNDAVIASVKTKTSAYIKLNEFIENNQKLLSDLGKTLAITAGIFATAAVAVLAFNAAAAFFATASLAAAISGTSVAVVTLTAAMGGLSTAAAAAWAAITGPVGLVVLAVAAVATGVYLLIKNWDTLQISAYNAAAAMAEAAAKAASYVNNNLSLKLYKEADAWRTKAAAAKKAYEDEQKALENLDYWRSEADRADGERQKRAKEAAAKTSEENQRKIREMALAYALEVQQKDSIALLNSAADLALDEQNLAHHQAMMTLRGEWDLEEQELFYANQETLLNDRHLFETEELRIITESEMAKAQAVEDAEARKKAILAASNKSILDTQKLQNKQEIESQKQRDKAKEDLDRKQISDRKDTYSTIATMANSNNKVLATIGKAAAITQIAIETPVAIAKALSAFPPPFNFGAAGLVATAMAVQAAQIAGVNFAQGGVAGEANNASGRVSSGSSKTGDYINANLNRDELILNPRQTANTLYALSNKKDLAGSGGNSMANVEILLGKVVKALEAGQSIFIGEKEIISVVREGIASGRNI